MGVTHCGVHAHVLRGTHAHAKSGRGLRAPSSRLKHVVCKLRALPAYQTFPFICSSLSPRRFGVRGQTPSLQRPRDIVQYRQEFNKPDSGAAHAPLLPANNMYWLRARRSPGSRPFGSSSRPASPPSPPRAQRPSLAPPCQKQRACRRACIGGGGGRDV